MATDNQPLRPFETQVQEGAVRAKRRARVYALGLRIRRANTRRREAAKLARARLRRAAFEIRATARSSATVAGVTRDIDRIGKAVAQVAPMEAAAAGRVRQGLARLKARARHAGARLRALVLRSSTVTGLAIDSRRVARRVRAAREGRHLRSAR